MKKLKRFNRGGRIRPRSFFEPLSSLDRRIVFQQMKGRKFDPMLLIGIAGRCIHGCPSVIACSPLRRGNPFPTTFWLTCPFLVNLCGERESHGAVSGAEKALETEKSSWIRYNLFHARLRIGLVSRPGSRFLARYRRSLWKKLCRGGVGGIDYSGQGGTKCIHLQAASWIALGHHPAGDFLKTILSPLCCGSPVESGCVRR